MSAISLTDKKIIQSESPAGTFSHFSEESAGLSQDNDFITLIDPSEDMPYWYKQCGFHTTISLEDWSDEDGANANLTS